MKIAVLAWGSLVWDPRDLEISTPFIPHGPKLPLEFCRISKDGRLTLVIDQAIGTYCRTFVATSKFTTLPEACENLYKRETGRKKVPVDWNRQQVVGMASAITWHCNLFGTGDDVESWRETTDYDAVIWTDLMSNFHEKYAPFTYLKAGEYMDSLRITPEKYALAADYINKAPQEVQTPVRQLFNMMQTWD